MASGAKGRRFKSCRARAGLLPPCALFLALLTATAPSHGLDPRPAAFLHEPLGARAIGIGSATTALLDDVSAIHANPAGLAFTDDYEAACEIGRSHARDYWSAISAAVPFQRRTTFGFSLSGTRLNSETQRTRIGNDYVYRLDIPARDELHGVANLAVGRMLRPELAIGAGIRYVSTRNEQYGSLYEGIYGSAGLRYNSSRTGMVAGLVLENLGGRLSGAPDPDLPWTARAGLAYGLMIRTAHYVNIAFDVVKMENRDPAVRGGVEYWFANYLGVRAGYDMLPDRAPGNIDNGNFSAGLSLNFRGVLYDFAIVPSTQGLRNARIVAGARLTLGEGRDR